MKVLVLSTPSSPHTKKWVGSLAARGLNIYLFGLFQPEATVYATYPNVRVETLGYSLPFFRKSGERLASKLKYLKAVPKVKQIIRTFAPDIVQAHYATSYGLIGALSGFRPYILSVWGSDVFDFPQKSPFHKALLQYNFRRADKILSTSHIMAKEIGKYTGKPIEVTPFGIDLTIFKPAPVHSLFTDDDIVIGVTKHLDEKYGIDYLIKAFKILRDKYPRIPLKLLIIGDGPQESYLKRLTRTLNLENDTVFAGRISNDDIQNYHNMISIFASLSVFDSESFGVATLEAAACEKPAVVSNVGGLPEVVEDGVTGFVVPARDPQGAAAALERLILDKNLRIKMGKAGRDRVKRLYNWPDNVQQMIDIYQQCLNQIDNDMTN